MLDGHVFLLWVSCHASGGVPVWVTCHGKAVMFAIDGARWAQVHAVRVTLLLTRRRSGCDVCFLGDMCEVTGVTGHAPS